MGRRERKKLATRQALVDAAVELFAEHGFDETTVAQIAERADVSTRTFFLHFPTKEDVLVGSSEERLEIGLRALAERVPGERPDDALARAMRLMIDDRRPGEFGLGRVRQQIARTAPSVQANIMRRRFEAERMLTAGLLRSFPDDLDDVDASAAVAAVMAATHAAATTALRSGAGLDAVRAAMHRAVDIAILGTRRSG
ncbi:hypothetical protein AFB00_24635 [Pseudonocardia sp. HH130630-07]|nr:hypothetical protein AFB00_24635 [Pseudonocardia sp. HH130630-07]